MKYLFSNSGLRTLESLSFANTLYSFDFDGTLAPIVNEPDNARMSSRTEDLLSRLGEMVPTAVISGRSLADLKTRLPGSIRFAIGNHGLEGIPGSVPLENARTQASRWLEQLTDMFAEDFSAQGIEIENKVYTIAIHYRKSRNKQRAHATIAKAIRTLDSFPRIIRGKLVYNLVTMENPHKGEALARLLPHARSKIALYIGDDDTDEDIFDLPDPRIATIRVGNRSISGAKYFIRRQDDIDSLLKRLIRLHEARQSTHSL